MQAVDIVTRYLPQGATKACEVLIEKAAELWRDEEGDYRDDITAVIVKVQEVRVGIEAEAVSVIQLPASLARSFGRKKNSRDPLQHEF